MVDQVSWLSAFAAELAHARNQTNTEPELPAADKCSERDAGAGALARAATQVDNGLIGVWK